MSKTPQLLHRSTRIRRAVGAVVATFASVAVLPLGTADEASAVGRTTYYVSPSGSDSASGTDASHPFRTVGRVSNLYLEPGDQILFERGGSWTGKMEMWHSGSAANHITIGAYGPANRPRPRLTNNRNDFCMMVGGSYITVSGLTVWGCRTGIWTRGTQNLITRVEATDNMHGVEVDSGSEGVRVISNYLHDNTHMAPNTPGEFDDYGAVGVVVMGDNTEVAYNRISGNVGPSADFGTDGSAVEIYGGIGTLVHHNRARDNRTFTELGNRRSANTTYAYNVSTSSLKDSEFLITRGNQDYFGPVRGTVAVNNTVKMTGANSLAFSCYAGCTPSTFTSSNNIFDVAGRIGWLDGGSMSGGNNIYWHGRLDVPMLPGDKYANPQFRNRRLMLHPTSPAVDQVAKPRMDRDLGGHKVGVDGNGDGRGGADIGARELAPAAPGGAKANSGGKNGGKHHGKTGRFGHQSFRGIHPRQALLAADRKRT
jgi:hypothetical protein